MVGMDDLGNQIEALWSLDPNIKVTVKGGPTVPGIEVLGPSPKGGSYSLAFEDEPGLDEVGAPKRSAEEDDLRPLPRRKARTVVKVDLTIGEDLVEHIAESGAAAADGPPDPSRLTQAQLDALSTEILRSIETQTTDPVQLDRVRVTLALRQPVSIFDLLRREVSQDIILAGGIWAVLHFINSSSVIWERWTDARRLGNNAFWAKVARLMDYHLADRGPPLPGGPLDHCVDSTPVNSEYLISSDRRLSIEECCFGNNVLLNDADRTALASRSHWYIHVIMAMAGLLCQQCAYLTTTPRAVILLTTTYWGDRFCFCANHAKDQLDWSPSKATTIPDAVVTREAKFDFFAGQTALKTTVRCQVCANSQLTENWHGGPVCDYKFYFTPDEATRPKFSVRFKLVGDDQIYVAQVRSFHETVEKLRQAIVAVTGLPGVSRMYIEGPRLLDPKAPLYNYVGPDRVASDPVVIVFAEIPQILPAPQSLYASTYKQALKTANYDMLILETEAQLKLLSASIDEKAKSIKDQQTALADYLATTDDPDPLALVVRTKSDLEVEAIQASHRSLATARDLAQIRLLQLFDGANKLRTIEGQPLLEVKQTYPFFNDRATLDKIVHQEAPTLDWTQWWQGPDHPLFEAAEADDI